MLSYVHNGYLWLESKINLYIDAFHRITGLSKVGNDPNVNFVVKKLDRKVAMKLTQQLKLKKGTRAYDSVDIEDCALCLLSSCSLDES